MLRFLSHAVYVALFQVRFTLPGPLHGTNRGQDRLLSTMSNESQDSNDSTAVYVPNAT